MRQEICTRNIEHKHRTYRSIKDGLQRKEQEGMREMVEYWKKARGESKTDDVNHTECRAYETLLDTSLTLYQYLVYT